MDRKVSIFTHFVDAENELVVLWNALTLGYVVLDKTTADIFRTAPNHIVSSETIARFEAAGGTDVITALTKHKLIFPATDDLDERDYRLIQEGLAHQRIGILYLLLADTCNLACRYCFISEALSSRRPARKMSPAVVKDGLNRFADALAHGCSVEEPQVIFLWW